MFVTLPYENILKNRSEYIFVDVRTPEEFSEATIPGAYNVPLFSDAQRKEIGTVYKKEGRQEATKLGIEFISNNLPDIYNRFVEISNNNKKIAIFCARGGMRSTSIGSLLNALGMAVVKIDFGYKGYRNFIVKNLANAVANVAFVPLYGQTGTGKTNILYHLENMGYPVLDLEKFANHRGSLLGTIGLGKQNSQKMFESLVFDKLYENTGGYIFTEGESKRIGKIIMPNYLYDTIVDGKKILVTANLEKRTRVIYDTYIRDEYNISEMIEGVQKLSVYIGEKRANQYITAIKENNFKYVMEELMVNYYDQSYRIKEKTFDFSIENIDDKETAIEIGNYINRGL